MCGFLLMILERTRGTDMKNKLVMIVLGILVICAAGAMGYAIYSTQSGKEVFAEDGYIIVYDDKDAEKPAKTYHFTEGTAFKRSYEGSIQFRDTDGNTVTADANSFVHYDSGASASLSKSVLVNLDEVGSSAVNYYGMGASNSVDRSGSSYSIAAQGGNIDLSNYLWKVGENHYMMVSDVITVSFTDGTEYTFDDYVELLYQEGGMVVIINGDTVLRDASKNAYVSTDTGISINLATQVILEDGAVRMSLGQITTDSEQVVNILPADENKLKIVIPQFNFEVIDGKNGEAGPDGSNGADGIDGTDGTDGTMGADGVGGTNGRTGLMGYDGDDGEAGQAGTSGRSGTNGTEGAEGADGAAGGAGAAGPQGGAGGAGGAGAAGAAGAAGPEGNDGGTGHPGTDGDDGDDEFVFNPVSVLKDVPVIYWGTEGIKTSFSEISGSFGFQMAIGAMATTIVNDVTVKLYDVESGSIVGTPYENRNINAARDGDTVTEFYNFNFSDLDPAKTYRLLIEGGYTYADVRYETVYDDRIIRTSDYPLEVSVYSIQKDSITVELVNKDPKISNGTSSGRYALKYKLVRKIPNRDDEEIVERTIQLSTSESKINVDNTTSDFVELKYNDGTSLTPDTTYYFSVLDFENNEAVPSRFKDIPIKTLKTMPTFQEIGVTNNVMNRSFDVSITDLKDPQKAVTGIRYEFYDAINDPSMLSPLKVYRAVSPDVVHCYVDDVDASSFNANGEYTVRAVLEVFDNQKSIELTQVFPGRLSLNGIDKYSWVDYINPDSVFPNSIGIDGKEAEFYIHMPEAMKIDPNCQNITIVYYADAFEEVKTTATYTDVTNTLTNGVGTSGEKVYKISGIFSNLRKKTPYKFTFLAPVFLNDGSDPNNSAMYRERPLGTKIITTPDYKKVQTYFSFSSSNGTSAVSFNMELRPLPGTAGQGDAFNADNDSLYAVKQAGANVNVVTALGQDTYQGKAHVKLYTNSADNPSGNENGNWDAVEGAETDIAMSYNNSSNNSIAPLVTLANFGNENTLLSKLRQYYRIKVEYAKDATEHSNMIPIDNEWSSKKEINKTYPDPSSFTVNLRGINKNNASKNEKNELNDLNGTTTYYEPYDSTTYIGFEAYANSGTGSGLLQGVLNCFTSITYYIYDRITYETQKVPRLAELPINAGTQDATSWVSPQQNASNPDKTKFFYPDDVTVTGGYAAKITLPLSGSSSENKTSRGATFIFKDLNSDNEAVREENLKKRNAATQSLPEDVIVVDVPERIYRGHDYYVTFRLTVDNTAMEISDGETHWYPEVLDDPAKVGILVSERYLAAPFEAPTYCFYPESNDDNSITYGYFIKSVDGTAIFSGVREQFQKLTQMTGNITPKSWTRGGDSSGAQNIILVNQDAYVKLENLTHEQAIELYVLENLYSSEYQNAQNDIKQTAFKRFFYQPNATPVLSDDFKVRTDNSTSTVEFELDFTTEKQARSVTAVAAHFTNTTKGNTNTNWYLVMRTPRGNTVEAYLPYSDLASFASTNDDISVTLTVYYDTGREGFKTGASYFNATTTKKRVAIREAGVGTYGNYIRMDFDSSKFVWESEESPQASRSMFWVNTNNTDKGAQVGKIKETFDDDNETNPDNDTKHGFLSLSFASGFKPDNSAQVFYTSLSGSGSVAQLGGVFDPKVAIGTYRYYTISEIDSVRFTQAATFKMGTIKPTIDIRTGSSLLNISPTADSATVRFKVSGMSGVGSAIYGYDQQNNKYGNLYFVMERPLENNNYEDWQKEDPTTHRQIYWMEEVPLTYAPNGDTDSTDPAKNYYEYTISNLEPNQKYSFRVVYFSDSVNSVPTTEEKLKDLEWNRNNRQYLPETRYPQAEVEKIHYRFETTKGLSTDTELKTRVNYHAEGYYDKYLMVLPRLMNGTDEAQLEPEQTYVCALFDQDDKLVLDHVEMQRFYRYFKDAENPGNKDTVEIKINPKGSPEERPGLIVGKNNGEDIYINFGGGDGDIHKYKIALIPVSRNSLDDQFNFSTNVAKWDNDDTHMSHKVEYQNKYIEWIKSYSIAGNKNSEWRNKVVYIDLRTKVKSRLSDPEVDIQTYPDRNKIHYKVSVVDVDGAIFGGRYVIKAKKGSGQLITTSYEDGVSTEFLIDSHIGGEGVLGDSEQVTIMVYAVVDRGSVGGKNNITYYSSQTGTDVDNSPNKEYTMWIASETTTDSNGFTLGHVEIKRTSQNGIYIDFVNPQKLGNVKALTIYRVKQSGQSGSSGSGTEVLWESVPEEYPLPDGGNNNFADISDTNTSDRRYRFSALQGKSFDNGYYQIILSMTVQKDGSNDDYQVGKILNYYSD